MDKYQFGENFNNISTTYLEHLEQLKMYVFLQQLLDEAESSNHQNAQIT